MPIDNFNYGVILVEIALEKNMNTKPLKYNKLIAVKLTSSQFEILDEVVKSGKFSAMGINSASEFIREAIDTFLVDKQGVIGWDRVENYFEQ